MKASSYGVIEQKCLMNVLDSKVRGFIVLPSCTCAGHNLEKALDTPAYLLPYEENPSAAIANTAIASIL